MNASELRQAWDEWNAPGSSMSEPLRQGLEELIAKAEKLESMRSSILPLPDVFVFEMKLRSPEGKNANRRVLFGAEMIRLAGHTPVEALEFMIKHDVDSWLHELVAGVTK